MSGLFDEWAYTHVYEPSSPVEKPAPEVPEPKVSLVKAVASLSIDPPPQSRPRANTFVVNKTNKVSWEEPCIDTPLLGAVKDKWSRKKWLAQADPDIFSFDQQMWQMQVAPYEQVRQKAELASCIAAETKSNADSLVREASWLLHEINDASTHDLSPLESVLERSAQVQAKQKMADNVKAALDIGWTNLEQIKRVLRGPAPRAVPQLPQLIADIDAGIAFCEKYPDFAGIGVALESWRQCGLRALAIAGAYVSHELRKITHLISSKLEAINGKGATNALIFAKYRSDALKLKPIISLIRERSNAGNTWLDLQRTYCELRSPLVSPDAQRFANDLNQFTEINDDFMDAARTAIVQTRQLCVSEQKLFKALFGEPTVTFNTWLGDVALPLYAAVRKLLVHETDIGKLCQVVVLVSDNSKEEIGYDINDKSSVIGSVGESLVGSIRAHTVAPSFRRASSIAPSVVAPSVASVAAPSITPTNDTQTGVSNAPSSMTQTSAAQTSGPFTNNAFNSGALTGELAEDAVVITGDPVRDLLAPAAQSRLVFRAHLEIDKLHWYEPTSKDFLRSRYPTVDTTLKLLGQVYELLNPTVFNELAHKCIRECLASLDNAVANRMANSSVPDTSIHLFHIKQLLILQSQISDFDLRNSVVHEVDFSGIQRLLDIASGSANQTVRTFRELLVLAWDSVPRVVDIMVDAMEEVFASLRRAVERMCSAFVQIVFSSKLSVDGMADLRTKTTEQFGELRKSIREYTTDVEFTHFLLDSAQEAIMDRYTTEYRQLSQEDQRNENVMDIDTMAAWLSSAITP